MSVPGDVSEYFLGPGLFFNWNDIISAIRLVVRVPVLLSAASVGCSVGKTYRGEFHTLSA